MSAKSGVRGMPGRSAAAQLALTQIGGTVRLSWKYFSVTEMQRVPAGVG
jgi:hypothetical protein